MYCCLFNSTAFPSLLRLLRYRPPLYIRVLQAFSIPRNVKHLMSPQPSTSGAVDLSSLNGIRVISMAWLILGHTMLWAYELCVSQEYLDQAVARRFSFSFILQAPLGVDAFFYMSGLLASYFLLKVRLTSRVPLTSN
jgi:hypothetical protein